MRYSRGESCGHPWCLDSWTFACPNCDRLAAGLVKDLDPEQAVIRYLSLAKEDLILHKALVLMGEKKWTTEQLFIHSFFLLYKRSQAYINQIERVENE